MADLTNVIISGLAPTMPKWATDATLREIEIEVKKLVDILQKKEKIKTVSTEKSQAALDDFEKTLQDLNDEQGEAEKSVKKLRVSFGDAAENTTDALEKIRASAHSGFASITNLTNAGQGLFSIFKNLTTPSSLLGGSFVLAGAALGSFIDYIKDTTQTMIGLYDTGLTFQNGLGDLRMAAATAAMPLDEFGKLMADNSAVIKGFGTQGAQGFANILKQTRDLVRQQGYYGLSISQVNAYTADYLGILRTQGLLARMSDMERASSSADYIKELTSFSQIMGKSREEINKQIIETMKNPELLAITGSLGPLGKQFTETMTSIIGGLSGAGGEQSGKIIGDVVTMIGTLNGPMTDLYQGLLAAGRGDLGKQILDLSNDIKNNAIPLDVAQQRLKQFLVGVQGLSQQDIQNLRNSTQVQGSALHDQAELIVQMNSNLQGLDLDKVTEKLVQEPDKFTEAVMKLSNLFGEIRGRIGVVFAKFLEVNQGSLDRIMTNISDFAEYLAGKLQVVLDLIGNLIDPATRQKAIDDILNGVSSVMNMILNRIADYIEIKLGLSSKEYVDRRASFRQKFAGHPNADALVDQAMNLTDPVQIESYKGTPIEAKRNAAFASLAMASGIDPNILTNPGPSPAPLTDKIMANSPLLQGHAGSVNLQDITDKQNEMFFKPVLDALNQGNDLTSKVVDLSDSANGHLVSIKRNVNSNPNIIRSS